MNQSQLAYMNDIGSCDQHRPRFDPLCDACKSRLQMAMSNEVNAGITMPCMEQSKKPPIVPLADHPVGHHEDGSFTMCPEVYQKFLRVMKYQLWIDHHSVDELADELYLRQRIATEQYT